MNEYTRREEIRWTLVCVGILVPCVAIAIVKLVLAQGPLVPNHEFLQAKEQAVAAQAKYTTAECVKNAEKLTSEERIVWLKKRAAIAKKQAEDNRPKPLFPYRKADEDKPVEYDIPWKPADDLLTSVRELHQAGCHTLSLSVIGDDKDAKVAWHAVEEAAKIKKPKSNKKKQAAAQKLLSLFDNVSDEVFKKHTSAVEKKLKAAAEAASKKADDKTSFVRAPLAQGLFPRGAAIGVGVGVALAALIISYISVRSAASRRAGTLHSLRRFANTPEAGLQAAAIVRLAAHHNGGEPGMVVGAALGGLAAALLANSEDPGTFIGDLFVAGSMGGLLIGLAGQWLTRTVTGMRSWRERTKELGEIEKPTIPVVLVLGGVTPGLEKQFMRYFEALPMADAAVVVQKLAAQAEDQILAAAEAGAQGAAPPAPQGSNPWAAGGGAPPGSPYGQM